MKFEYTQRAGSRRLILIFAGWGTGAEFYRHIRPSGYDVAVVSEYLDMEFDRTWIEGYDTVCLFAWSLGVYMAAATVPFDRLAMAVAVNGTMLPVNDGLGIPAKTYLMTAENLDERNLLKFRRRMCGDAYSATGGRYPERPVGSLRDELMFVAGVSLRHPVSVHWDRAYIADADAIFPTPNMRRFWQGYPMTETVEVAGPHYIDLADVVSGIIPDTGRIAERFSKARNTYGAHASAQARIALRLAGMMPEGKYADAVEIGPGNEPLGRLIPVLADADAIDYVDLYGVELPGTAAVERLHVEDAEEWMAREARQHPESRDAVISASSIQWLADPARFFANASKLLRPGGVMAVSTFLPGNLPELKGLNPYGLLYRNPSRLRDMLRPWFGETHTESGTERIEFDNPRQSLSHLRQTGVGGSATASAKLGELLANAPASLTFKPFYIIARK